MPNTTVLDDFFSKKFSLFLAKNIKQCLHPRPEGRGFDTEDYDKSAVLT